MKKYFIQYPLYPECNLNCLYCLHGAWRKIDGKPEFKWSIDDYLRWRDKCLESGADIVIHLSSGEPEFGRNKAVVDELMANTDRETFDILINGTLPTPETWLAHKYRIASIGATYHRKTVTEAQGLAFIKNVLKMRDDGLPVHVKELAFKSLMPETLAAKDFWEDRGVPFKIQHYRKSRCDSDADGEIDEDLIWKIEPEYVTYDFDADCCACRKGHEGIILRLDGRVLACWHDQRIVGDIREATYAPGSRVVKHVADGGKIKYRVYLPGEDNDVSIGKTVGDLYKQFIINRRGRGMSKELAGSPTGAQQPKTVDVQTYVFGINQRYADAVQNFERIFSDMANLICQQNAAIADLNKKLSAPKDVPTPAVDTNAMAGK